MNPTGAERLWRGGALRSGPELVNVALHFERSARTHGDRAAIIAPSGRRGWRATSYLELEQRCDAIAHGLVERGVVRGDRVALFVRPGTDLIAITFALFKLGAVPILIDPGMGRAHVVACLVRLKPRVFIGVPLAHALRMLALKQLRSIAIAIVVGRKLWPDMETLDSIARPSRGAFDSVPTARDETAAILFTSGSTGPAKGVVYTHGMFDAQIRALKALYGFRPLERDLACFPLFALFDVALETTCVFPRLDPLRPAQCDPRAIADAIIAHGVTYGFGSPAIWRRVVPWAIEHGVRFPTLTRALVAGAPVSPTLVAGLRSLLGQGGHGSCLGRAAPGIEIGLVRLTPGFSRAGDPIEFLTSACIGEICVRGEVVTRAYAEDEEATRDSKIGDPEGLWHRTGDAGYIDEQERLWTVGRVAHRVETRTGTQWPAPIENVCDAHPRARRTAFVGAGTRGKQRPCLLIEPLPGEWPRSQSERATFAAEMRALVRARAHTGSPATLAVWDSVFFCRGFPVDVRHNAKIRREELAVFAEEQGA